MWSPMGRIELEVPGRHDSFCAELVASVFEWYWDGLLRPSKPQEESTYGTQTAGRGVGTSRHLPRDGDQTRYHPEVALATAVLTM